MVVSSGSEPEDPGSSPGPAATLTIAKNKVPIKMTAANLSLEQIAQNNTAQALAQGVGPKAFELFQNKKFRQYLSFDQIPQVERDRIFNELVLAILTMIMLTLEAPDLRTEEPDLKDHLKKVQNKIPKAYVKILKEMGVEEKYLKDWKKLIWMRFEEYRNDRLKTREAAMILETQGKDLSMEELNKIHLLLPMQTVAIGCHHHICRSQTGGKDDLFKLILKWLGNHYVELRIRLEGGNITSLQRVLVKIRRLFDQIFKQ